MKCVTIIIHTDDQQELTRQLRAIEQIQGFTIFHAEGHGQKAEQDAFLSARGQIVGSTPQVGAKIILQDENLDVVIGVLRRAKEAGKITSAYYWITAVEQDGHL